MNRVLTALVLLAAGLRIASVAAQPKVAFVAVDLGTLGGTNSGAVAVNSHGQVVGGSTLPGDTETHAFSWTEAGGMVDLGTLGGRSIAPGVNDKGQVVGYSDLSTAGTHAFVWTEQDGLIDLGTLGTYSFAHDINDRGAVVGSSNPPNAGATAFLWTERGGMIGLSDFFTADAVNAKEQIMGLRTTGQSTPNGYPVFHGVFWTEATGMVDIGSAAGS